MLLFPSGPSWAHKDPRLLLSLTFLRLIYVLVSKVSVVKLAALKSGSLPVTQDLMPPGKLSGRGTEFEEWLSLMSSKGLKQVDALKFTFPPL